MSSFAITKYFKKKYFKKMPYYIWKVLRRGRPSQMIGRIFDLRKKRLVKLNGFQLFVMPNDYIGRSIIESKTHEPEVTAVIRRVLKEGDVFLDIGANIGYFTMLASSLVRASGKVIAFEPNPQNLQLIYSSLLESHVENVTVYPYAVSDKATILRFVTVGSNGGVITDKSNAAGSPHHLLVPSVVLDEILKNELKIDLIKIDIEAHEPAAIRGLEGLIKKLRPRIITEFFPWAMPGRIFGTAYSFGL
jgi:FkbM family methyltransferase